MLLISFLFLRPDPDPEVKKTEACVCVCVCGCVCMCHLCVSWAYVNVFMYVLRKNNAICWGDNRVGRYSVLQEKQFVSKFICIILI